MLKIKRSEIIKISLIGVFLFVGIFLLLTFVENSTPLTKVDERVTPEVTNNSPTLSPTPTVSPTPKPLSFSEMQSLYGPCTHTPVLFYHHIQTKESAEKNNQMNLSVFTNYFEKQMAYLSSQNYSAVGVEDLVNFFANGITLPKKVVILSFDDGYEDFYTDAYPILKKYNFKAMSFLPTGLMENPGYLTWVQIQEMAKSGLVYFGNHTWSHHTVFTDKATAEREIKTADTQLASLGLNPQRIFAYPYGNDAPEAESILTSLNYNLAFTTHNGSILCKKQALELPRIRIGNADLESYGF